MQSYDPEIYNNREWYESLKWQHRWIEFMVGWWVGQFGKPQYVLDLGAGDGWWCKALKDLGTEAAYAVEIHTLAREYIPDSVYFVHGDLREVMDAEGRFDLVICLEVAEHLPKDSVSNLCETLSNRTGDKLLFSAAGPGQEGMGHVNLQPLGYWVDWIEKYKKLRLSRHCTDLTRSAFRNLLDGTPFEFLTNNVLVFARI